MTKTIHTLDAKGMRLGRIASAAAHILLGKTSSDFAKNKTAAVTVNVINAGGLEVTVKKMDEKNYITYSGYPGGLHSKKMSQVVAKKGFSEVIRDAVYGMLPSNRLRSERMKNLIITE